jgi:hypothetical protein
MTKRIELHPESASILTKYNIKEDMRPFGVLTTLIMIGAEPGELIQVVNDAYFYEALVDNKNSFNLYL